MFRVGLIGTIITAICCFTPVLVWGLAAVGLSGLVVYVDMFLIPLLGLFIVLMLWAFTTQSKPSR